MNIYINIYIYIHNIVRCCHVPKGFSHTVRAWHLAEPNADVMDKWVAPSDDVIDFGGRDFRDFAYFSKGWEYGAGNKGFVKGLEKGYWKGPQGIIQNSLKELEWILDPNIIDVSKLEERDLCMFAKGFHYHCGNHRFIQKMEGGKGYGKAKGGLPLQLGKGPGPRIPDGSDDESSASMDILDEVEKSLTLQSQLFWSMEVEARVRNGGLTPMEAAEMGR